MNNLVNALEALYDSLVTIENHDRSTRIRGFLVGLLHTDEFSLSDTDPNHPYTRFAKRNDAEGNRLRLFQAVQDLIDDTNSDLQPCVDMMFEIPSAEPYNAVTTLLRKYRIYAESHSSDSDSDGDSDSS